MDYNFQKTIFLINISKENNIIVYSWKIKVSIAYIEISLFFHQIKLYSGFMFTEVNVNIMSILSMKTISI